MVSGDFISAEFISAAGSILSSASFVILIWQVKVNHDKGRREKALSILEQWDKIRTDDAFRLELFLFSLSHEDVKHVKEGESFYIEKNIAEKFLPELLCRVKNGKCLVDVITSFKVRHAGISLLNTIESIALAYKHNVADRDILDQAFKQSLIKDGYLQRLSEFSKLMGNNYWPAIQELPKFMDLASDRDPAA